MIVFHLLTHLMLNLYLVLSSWLSFEFLHFGHQGALFMYLDGSMTYCVLGLSKSEVFLKLSVDLIAQFHFFIFGHQGALYKYFYGSFHPLNHLMLSLMFFPGLVLIR